MCLTAVNPGRSGCHHLHGDLHLYRRGGQLPCGSHIAVNMLTDRLPGPLKTVCARAVDLLMLLIAGLMFWYSYWLCVELWEQPVAEFPVLTSGESYLPLPVALPF